MEDKELQVLVDHIQNNLTLDEGVAALKARDAAIRIDENENWLRFAGAAWDADPVLADDLHKRIKELRRESDLVRSKEENRER